MTRVFFVSLSLCFYFWMAQTAQTWNFLNVILCHFGEHRFNSEMAALIWYWIFFLSLSLVLKPHTFCICFYSILKLCLCLRCSHVTAISNGEGIVFSYFKLISIKCLFWSYSNPHTKYFVGKIFMWEKSAHHCFGWIARIDANYLQSKSLLFLRGLLRNTSTMYRFATRSMFISLSLNR